MGSLLIIVHFLQKKSNPRLICVATITGMAVSNTISFNNYKMESRNFFFVID